MARPLFTASILLLFAAGWSTAVAEESIPRVTLGMSGDRLRLAVIGDLHGEGAARIAPDLAAAHRREPFDGILVLGDNLGPCGVNGPDDPRWNWIRDHLSPLGVPLFPTLGNHDYGNPKRKKGIVRICGDASPGSQIGAAIEHWNFPARNYVISTPLVDIVVADTTPLIFEAVTPVLGSSTPAEVIAFVREAMSSSTKRWIIVAGHHNLALHSGKLKVYNAEPRQIMGAFGAMLTELGASLYLCGHQHQLELIDRTATSPVALISGATASSKDAASLRRREPSSLYLASSGAKTRGFAIVEIKRDQIRITMHDAAAPSTEAAFTILPRESLPAVADSEPTEGARRSDD